MTISVKPTAYVPPHLRKLGITAPTQSLHEKDTGPRKITASEQKLIKNGPTPTVIAEQSASTADGDEESKVFHFKRPCSCFYYCSVVFLELCSVFFFIITPGVLVAMQAFKAMYLNLLN